MSDFTARVMAELDTKKAEAQLQQLQNSNKKIDIQVNLTSPNANLNNILKNLQNQAKAAGTSAGTGFSAAFNSSLNNININNGASAIYKMQKTLKSLKFDHSSIDAITQDLNQMDVAVQKVSTRMRGNDLDITVKGVDEMGRAVTVVKQFDGQTGKIKTSSKTIAQSFNQVTKATQQLSNTQVKDLGNQMTIWANKNTKAVKAYSQELVTLRDRLSKCTTIDEFKSIKAYFNSLKLEAQATGNVGKTLGETFTSALGGVAKFAASYVSIQQVFNAISNGVSTVIDLDTALVDLQKTCSASFSEINGFYNEANEIAKQYGATTQQIIQSAADWTRLGYNLDEAKLMSQYSSMFASISPGMDVDTATNGLVSIMKAFDIEAEDALDGILSKVNAVGNGFALANDDIVEALAKSSSAMVAANNTFDETVALITAGTEITQDAASMGNALKTISMRIRGRQNIASIYSNVYAACA